MLITCQVIRIRYTTEHDLPLVVNSSALIYADDSTIHTSTEIIEENFNHRDNMRVKIEKIHEFGLARKVDHLESWKNLNLFHTRIS